jgi:hypothetical protein
MRTIQYTHLIWAIILTTTFGFLLIAPNMERIIAFCLVLAFTVITIFSFKNYRWAWAICIGTAICIFSFLGIPVLLALLPTKANLAVHNESPGGTIILLIYSILFLVPPAILFCYYLIHWKKVASLFKAARP